MHAIIIFILTYAGIAIDMNDYFLLLAIIFSLIIVFHILSRKAVKYHSFFMKLAGYTGLIYIIIFIISLLETSLRYKIYPPSSYQLVLKEGPKTYPTDYYIPFIYDRLTGEIYIGLVHMRKTHSSLSDGSEFNTLFLIDNREYNFRKGDFRLNYNPDYVTHSKNQCGLAFKKEDINCDILLKYNNKTLSFHFTGNFIDPKLKEIADNGTYYGYAFSSFKSFFNVNLSVVRDDDKKVIYLVRDE